MRALTTLENHFAEATNVINIDFPWPPKNMTGLWPQQHYYSSKNTETTQMFTNSVCVCVCVCVYSHSRNYTAIQ